MADVHTKVQRSYNMSRIKSKNTAPEMIFRRYVWKSKMGGYRVSPKLIGRPDLYFPGKRTAVFIDGCFWHKCPKCYVEPKSRIRFWQKKIKENVDRDLQINKQLGEQNIKVFRIWEHEIKNDVAKCYTTLMEVLKK